MQGTVASLMLITTAVMMTCLVVGYSVSIVQQTVSTTTNVPQIDQLRNMQNQLLNQTQNFLNQISTENNTTTNLP